MNKKPTRKSLNRSLNRSPTPSPSRARHDSRKPAAATVPPHALLACAGAGLLIGQVVAGIAAHQPNAALGLAMALVFLVSGSASVLSLARHWHLQLHGADTRHGSAAVAPVRSWTLALGAGVLASLHAASLFAG